ncbi:MAG TPA: carbamoyltransferase C-terminal domain-containing protein [Vicinamibacterales bacterium]|nr:carbamoyltransferase C-terminal domain-containing protein [Vicinamibacterales bacterium]
MLVLGINAYHGDVAAAILRDGQLVAAVEEERFRRVKHYAGFPREAVRACLAMAGAEARDIDAFAVSRDPKAHLWRKGVFALKHRPSLSLIRDRAANVMSVRRIADACASTLGLDESHVSQRMHYVEHHAAHLASSFFASPFDDAAVCAIDGFGDFVSTSTGLGRGPCLAIQHRVFFPHSLGLLYLALTQFLGFPKYGDEFKVMGLAPYGEPSFVDRIRQLVRVGDEGQLCLDLSYFTHWSGGMTMTWDDGEPEIGRVFTPKLEALLGPARRPEEPLQARHEAIAASLQRVYEESAFGILRALHARVRNPRLALAGGCAMNSVANGKIRSETPFTDVYIQPAAGDNGTALGAALHVWHQRGGERRFEMRHGYWGPQFDEAAIAAAIEARHGEIEARRCTRSRISSEEQLCEWTASRIADGNVVGWFQGRMEWGARALGNRSIVADPRRRDMRDIINVRIKLREKFRPFAPSVAVEALNDFFVDAVPDPFMVQVYPVRPDKRDVIPAVTHVDGSGRLQTVSRDANARYWSLIQAFGRKTGVPVLLNTSFNENEPIVLTPEQALDCFLRTDMDVLVMGSHVLEKVADGSGRVAGGGR